ncbi:carbon-nitrogen hydrolase family protein [Naasia sp. SYSU D00057]|uniref:carbon-nitrogen hydrolase family protein n=1 Tax=Naasia sp. SYSU D00057 TaxID=2817380 RepID=UPI001B308EC6|nr:carbon-nitrogen hydrolase family protein [Naasia sp. SYSU D00057]
MARLLRVAGVQAPPLPVREALPRFRDDLGALLAVHPDVDLVVYPELHLFGSEEEHPDSRVQLLRDSAVPLDSELVASLGALAAEHGIWLVPGSICERGPAGELFNTELVFGPDGALAGHYRKIFPWRPYEPYDPGDRFEVVDAPGVGRLGLSICYDAWFPELSRHVAWLGAEVILNVVKTTTPDRRQELVLARANAITNQVFMVSINCAAPVGEGRSLIVDPEGEVIVASDTADPEVLVATIDLDHVTAVREHGTQGLNRLWAQFRESDAPIELPLYSGRIDPARWAPAGAPAPAPVPPPPATASAPTASEGDAPR